MAELEKAFRAASARFSPASTPPAGLALMLLVAMFWAVAFYSAFYGHGLSAWAIGVAFIAYDFALALYVLWEARKIWTTRTSARPRPIPSLAVIVAAYNEADALTGTIDALLAQTFPPQRIWIADDGSTDDSANVLAARYGLMPPAIGFASAPSPKTPALRWLRLPHRGKAHALNGALLQIEADVVVTVDADTLLRPDALERIAAAFAERPTLTVGGGIIVPRCSGGAMAQALQAFQRFEYVRNFLGRNAWTGGNALLLMSGAFAAYRTSALKAVGGFDPDNLTEDYELMHRLHRFARDRKLDWRVDIIGDAVASTDAPATLRSFLRQRRRWFAGFLQTHYTYRAMIGSSRYGALGLAMLPVKTLDAAQPIYGLAAFALLILFIAEGRPSVAFPAGALAIAKIGFDIVNLTILIESWRRWTGERGPRRLALAWLCLIVEPLSFQPLRHLGAAWGWLSFLAGRLEWGRVSRIQAVARPNSSSDLQ